MRLVAHAAILSFINPHSVAGMKSREEYKQGLSGRNDKYAERESNLGSYQTSPAQFPNPEGMVVFSGFGADEADLERGWCKPVIAEHPAYDKSSYADRWTQYRVPDEDSDGGEDMPSDIEFRMKDRETKGLFVRPRIPTER